LTSLSLPVCLPCRVLFRYRPRAWSLACFVSSTDAKGWLSGPPVVHLSINRVDFTPMYPSKTIMLSSSPISLAYALTFLLCYPSNQSAVADLRTLCPLSPRFGPSGISRSLLAATNFIPSVSANIKTEGFKSVHHPSPSSFIDAP